MAAKLMRVGAFQERTACSTPEVEARPNMHRSVSSTQSNSAAQTSPSAPAIARAASRTADCASSKVTTEATPRSATPEAPAVGRLDDERDLAAQLRRDLLDSGVTRVELHTCTDAPPREWMRMHDVRTTGITWMAVRGDEPMMIMARAGHADLKTTLGYVSRAALVRRSYGQVFPPIPHALVVEAATESATSARNADESAEAHGNRKKAPVPPRAISHRWSAWRHGRARRSTSASPRKHVLVRLAVRLRPSGCGGRTGWRSP